jgi:hypothetical protein
MALCDYGNANEWMRMAPVGEPEAYRRFFAALEKAMFLTAHQVDCGGDS